MAYPALTVEASTLKGSTVTFIQLWTFPSQENQQQFIHTMKDQFEIIMRMPGFIAMALHPGLDGTHAVVYAQWRNLDAYEHGINDPRAKRGHEELAKWGDSSEDLYQVDTVFLPIVISQERLESR